VDVPEPVTVVGERLHEEVVFVTRLTTPPNPFTALIVIVDVPVEFTLTLTLDGPAAIVKSWTMKAIVTLWASNELVPVTPTWNVPVDVKVHERVEDPEPVTLPGDTVQDVLFVVRVTTPVNPLTEDTVTVDVPGELTFTLMLVGLAEIVKSWTTNVTFTE